MNRSAFALGALASVAVVRAPARAAQWSYKYASKVSNL
jgi:hypothetical protein